MEKQIKLKYKWKRNMRKCLIILKGNGLHKHEKNQEGKKGLINLTKSIENIFT